MMPAADGNMRNFLEKSRQRVKALRDNGLRIFSRESRTLKKSGLEKSNRGSFFNAESRISQIQVG